jgi:hypothetical protein
MPGYIQQALHKLQDPSPAKPQHAPHKHNEVEYGTKTQLTKPTNQLPPLPKDGINQIINKLLHYSQVVNNTILIALSKLSSTQTKGMEAVKNLVASQLLNYCATHS